MSTIFRSRSADDHYYVGKNHEAPYNCQISIMINPAGEEKEAFVLPPDQPASWVARYRSITCNEICKDLPSGGMNEKGLIVEGAPLWNTIYPNRDGRPAVRESQWIQFMLDSCSSTEEAVIRSESVRIAQETSRIQYLICDATGDACLIEFVQGKPILYRDHGLVYPVVVDDLYTTCLDYLKTHEGYGGSKPITKSDLSIDRFTVTVDNLIETQIWDAFDCFGILDTVISHDDTRYSLVYDLTDASMLFRARDFPVEIISLGNISSAGRTLVHAPGEKEFSPLTFERNCELLRLFAARDSSPWSAAKEKELQALALHSFRGKRQ